MLCYRLKLVKVKNVSRDNHTGDKLGQIHMERQDLSTMQVRRVKALRKSSSQLRGEKAKDAREEDVAEEEA